jgi:hypothetical protein
MNNWYKISQRINVGYKIVGFNGTYAYSIYDIKHKISLVPNSIIKNSYLGTSREYVINYFSGGTNDRDLLLTYRYNPEDVLKGDPDHKNGEILVKSANLIKVEELGDEMV